MSNGFYFNEGDAKDFVERPSNLKGVFNAFSLYVDGESMEPRYYPGELLYVDPTRPLTRNCYVAVELSNGLGLIKQFISRTDDEVVLRQFNPPKDFHLKASEVKHIFKITGSAVAS